MRFAEYRATLRQQYGNATPSTAVNTEIDKFINRAYEEVARVVPNAWWLRRYFSIQTYAQLTGAAAAATGVTLTGGSATATFGASSRLDRRFIGALLRVGSEQESYLIRDVTSTTVAIIDPPYTGAAIGTAASDQSFTLTGWNYRLPPDLISTYVVKQSQSPVKLIAQWDRSVQAQIPDPSLLGQTGDPFWYSTVYGGGLPDFWGSAIQAQIGGTAGNVVLVNGSSTVIGGSTTPDFVNAVISTNASAATSLLPTMFIRFASDSRYYRIRSVTSGTSITLDEPYQGSAATDVSFRVMPGNSPWIRFYPLPDSRMQVDIEYHAMPSPLQGDEEEPRLPQELHSVVSDGGLYHLARYMSDAQMMNVQERQFDVGLARARQLAESDDDRVWQFSRKYGPPVSDLDAFIGVLPSQIVTG